MSEEKEPRGFESAKKKTESLLENSEQLKDLVASAKEKAKEKQQQIKSVWKDFQTLLRFVYAWWRKDYQEIPWKTILYAATAVFYFVSPFDLIPDFIPFGGFIDDVTVISFVAKALKSDLDKFTAWENSLGDEG